jgi:sigma-B regulation protein RsbU (phosphoserine phosphatase)
MTVKLSEADRLTRLTEILRELGRDPDPVRSVNNYATAMRSIYGSQGLISISMRNLEPGHYRVMRFIHEEGVPRDHYPDMPFAGPGAPVYEGGLVGEIIAGEVPVVFRDLHVEHDPVLGTQLAPYRLLVALPTFFAGETTNWVIYVNTNPNALSAEDIETRFLQSNLMGGLSNNKRITKELLDASAWIQREVDEIATIQRNLLPSEMPRIDGVEMAANYGTFDRAGGDYYDVFPMGMPCEGTSDCVAAPEHPWWGVLIADASGHGPSAAVVMAMLSALLRSFPRATRSPGEILEYLNARLTSMSVNHSFVTAFLIMIDTSTKTMTFASAGHNWPFVKSDGCVKMLQPDSGLPLGINAAVTYPDVTRPYLAGDSVLLYTDGVTEARSPKGALFGEEGLRKILAQSEGSIHEVLDSILRKLREYEGNLRPTDDQTMVLIRV